MLERYRMFHQLQQRRRLCIWELLPGRTMLDIQINGLLHPRRSVPFACMLGRSLSARLQDPCGLHQSSGLPERLLRTLRDEWRLRRQWLGSDLQFRSMRVRVECRLFEP
jgi:hypothetical protein